MLGTMSLKVELSFSCLETRMDQSQLSSFTFSITNLGLHDGLLPYTNCNEYNTRYLHGCSYCFEDRTPLVRKI